MLGKVASMLVKNGARLGSSRLKPLVNRTQLASRGFYIHDVKNTPTPILSDIFIDRE